MYKSRLLLYKIMDDIAIKAIFNHVLDKLLYILCLFLILFINHFLIIKN